MRRKSKGVVLTDAARQILPEARNLLASVTELLDLLLDGTCEVALMYDLGIRPEVATTVLYRVRPYVVLSADHRLAATGPISLTELADEPMIMLDMPPSAEMFREVLAVAAVEPLVRFSTTNFESVRSLVASGAGYSLLLQRPSPDSTYAGPPLVYREIVEDVLTVDVVLAHARDARLTRRAQAFTDFCRETFRG
jgi:DNA-binding transcriptional LysR family regulator